MGIPGGPDLVHTFGNNSVTHAQETNCTRNVSHALHSHTVEQNKSYNHRYSGETAPIPTAQLGRKCPAIILPRRQFQHLFPTQNVENFCSFLQLKCTKQFL